MAHKDVTITIKVKLSVPEDVEYDEESYFQALKEDLTNHSDFEREDVVQPLEEVDKIEVELIPECNQDGGECADHLKHYGGN